MPPQFPTRNIRDLLQSGGDPSAILSAGREGSQNVGSSVPSPAFGQALMNLLRQYQQQGGAIERGAQQEQAQRVLAKTPEELIGASPQIQAGVRSASASALEPTIGGARELVREATAGINDVRDFLRLSEEAENKRRDDARSVVKDALTLGGADSLKDLDPEQIQDLEKKAGYPKGYLHNLTKTMKERELQLKREQQGLGIPGISSAATGVISPTTGKAEDVLKGIDAGTAQIVRNLTEYKIPLPSGFALRSPYWQRILSLASLYDPTFDATQYNVRLKLKQDFTSGKSASNIRSLNTVIGHLDTLKNKASALHNSPLQVWNRVKNFGLTSTGDKRVVEFLNAANAVESELANVFKGTGATDQEIKAWRSNLSEIQSPQQLLGAINTALELINSRAEALKGQYEVGLGKPKDFHFLNSRSRQILKNLGQDPDIWDPVAGGSLIERGGRRLQAQ